MTVEVSECRILLLPFFRWRGYGARESSQGSALRSDERAQNAPLTRLPLRSCVASSHRKNVRKKWEPGRSGKARMSQDTIPCASRRNERSTAEKHAVSGEHPGFVRCLSGLRTRFRGCSQLSGRLRGGVLRR